jgi:dihydroflavonol-4-reductase
MSQVLVTGGSGFLGGHTILQLLAHGHQVRTSVRNLAREADVRSLLSVGGAEAGDKLAFVVADLTNDTGWADAVAGCDYVMHVASPLPFGLPKHEDDLIVPARDGTLRVLRAARDAGVKRVVLTSSFAALSYGHAPRDEPFTESDWTDLSSGDLPPYVKSKTIAERAAWDFIAREGGALELAVINPVAVFGPVLGPELSASIHVIKSLLDGKIPMTPRIRFGIADVRDTVDLHLRAMTDPAARGERFLATNGDTLSLNEVAMILREHAAPLARRVPRFEPPDWVVRVAALGVPKLRQIVPQLGKIRRASSAKAQRVLGWTPRSSQETIVATAESLARMGLLRG